MHLHPELVTMARLSLGLRAAWPRMDWARWTAAADRHGVLPLLALRARTAGVQWVLEAAETAVARTRARLAVLGLEAKHAFSVLANAGIPAASFKGFAVGRRAYPEEGARPITDFDVLVSASNFLRAVEALEATGFRRRGDPRRPVTFERADSWILTTPRGTALDLHRAVARARVFPVDHEALLERTGPGLLTGERWLDPTDELHVTCLHHAKHSLRVMLLQILDAAMLVSTRPDWDRLVSDARRWRTACAIWISLGWVRAIDPERVPDEVLAALRPGAVRARAIDAALSRIGPTTTADATASRLQQALVYALTTRARDLSVDTALYAKTRLADSWRGRG